MIKSDRFDTTGLLPDPKVDAPHSRSTADLKRANGPGQNGNIRPGNRGNDLVNGITEGGDGEVAEGSYIDRLDSLC